MKGRRPPPADPRDPVEAGWASRGGVLVVAGPDGTGKSALAEALADRVLAGRPVRRFASRFGALPARPNARVATTTPHAKSAYPAWLSAVKVGYLFADYVVGWFVVARPFMRRGGWVIMERGWWDLAIDPRRYRLGPSTALARRLGRLLPDPTLTLILDAPADVVGARKAELPPAEIERQLAAWRAIGDRSRHAVLLDASKPLDEVEAQAASAIRRRLDAAAEGAWLDRHWVHLPPGRRTRWTVPTDNRRAATTGLRIFQPMTLRGQMGWEVTRLFAAAGLLGLLPPDAPPAVLEPLARFIPPGGTVAVAHGADAEQAVALILDARGVATRFAKVARDPVGRTRLEREIAALAWAAPLLPPPLHPPRLLAHEDGIAIFEAYAWQSRLRPWLLPAELADAIGRFHRSGRPASGDPTRGPAHGDFAPWNLLRVRQGWVLVDWEAAEEATAAFSDVFHYAVQAHALLGHPTEATILRALGGYGPFGLAMRAYAEAAEVPLATARTSFRDYLVRSQDQLDPTKRHWTRSIEARQRLLRSLEDGR